MTPIQSWKDLMVRLPELTEADLIVLINYEVSLYRRQAILRRLHSRFNMIRSAREREALIKGEMLL